MPNFSKARVGDDCYDLRYGPGKITGINTNQKQTYPLSCEFDLVGVSETYTLDGFSDTAQKNIQNRPVLHGNPLLYHSRPKISDPPPPKRKVQRTVYQNWFRSSSGRVFPETNFFGYETKEQAEKGIKDSKKRHYHYLGSFPTLLEYEEE